MSEYNPEMDVPASPSDLHELSTALRGWLVDTGHPGATNDQAPLGLAIHEIPTGDLIEPMIVPIAPNPVIYRRTFDTDDIHFLVPNAAAVLGLGREDFFITHYGAYIPCQDIQSRPGEYAPPRSMFIIPKPIVPGIGLRAYKLAEVGGVDMVLGARYDRSAETDRLITDADNRDPRITATECKVLARVGQACMLIYSSERERRHHGNDRR